MTTASLRIHSELAKGKDCGEIYGKFTGELLKRLNGAVGFSHRQRLKTSTLGPVGPLTPRFTGENTNRSD